MIYNPIRSSIAWLAALALVMAAILPFSASANTLQFAQPASTAAATTTLTYMTPGTATTTLTYDSYAATGSNQSYRGDNKGTLSAGLLLQVTASSTSSTFLVNQEFSQDGIDWYQTATPTFIGYSTTSQPVNVTVPGQYKWTYASSTPGLGGVASTTVRDARFIPFISPTRYTRFIFTMQLAGTNGAVWATVIPLKENTQ